MKIGIPKGLATYEYPILFVEFFKGLGCEVVMSRETDMAMLQEGQLYSIDENCLASKIYMGHVKDLVDRKEKENIDYIFIPRLCSFENNETMCVKFYALYDICATVFSSSFITLNIDTKQGSNEMKAYVALGKKLGFTKNKVLASYLKARKMQRAYDKSRYEKQMQTIEKESEETIKVLLVAHSYIAHDAFLGKKVSQYLKKLGVSVYFAQWNQSILQDNTVKAQKKTKNVKLDTITHHLYWKSSKLLMNGMIEYEDKMDGILYLSTFPCGPDSLVNELAIRKMKTLPSIQIILDEQEAMAGLYTRLESFVDVLEQRKIKESTMKDKAKKKETVLTPTMPMIKKMRRNCVGSN